MARARNIKPALFRNEVLGVADPLYTLLFQSLWLLADREGRLEDRPIRIKADTFPYRDGLNVDVMLTWLHDNGFIIRYSIRGNRYIQVCNFTKHQNPHKNEAGSVIPSFSDGCTTSEKIGTTSEKIGSAPADSLNLIPDSGFPLPLQREEEQENKHLFTDPDTRRFFTMPMDWQPDPVELQKYVDGKIHAGKPLTLEQVMAHLPDYREATHAKGEKRTESEWCRALVKWAQKCLLNPKPVEKPSHPPSVEKKTEYWTPDPKRMMTPDELAVLHAGRALLK